MRPLLHRSKGVRGHPPAAGQKRGPRPQGTAGVRDGKDPSGEAQLSSVSRANFAAAISLRLMPAASAGEMPALAASCP